MAQKAFVLDLNKCTGCQACQLACSIENGLDSHMSWRDVVTFNEHHHPGIPAFHLSLACNHCIDPPCMEHCPANAYAKDPATGAVTIDSAICIGCRYCSWACPYDAPQFNASTGLMEKCTFCHHRLAEGKRPACVSLCPTGALQFAEYGEARGDSRIHGFPQTAARPAIHFIPVRSQTATPQTTISSPARSHLASSGLVPDPPASKITLRSEWPLVVFTTLAAFLVGHIAAQPASAGLPPLVLLAMGLTGMALSTLHLGRRRRAYRAIVNWRRSSLSREVIFFSTFLVLAAAYLLSLSSPWLRWTTVAVGFAALYAMDRVYRVTATPGLGSHSAQTTLTAALFWGILSGMEWLFVTVGLLKLISYVQRKYRFKKSRQPVRPSVSSVRTIGGFVLPTLLILSPGLGWHGLTVGFVLLGEIIDRCEFYMELDVPTPRRQMALDVESMIRSRLDIPVAACD